MTSRVELDINEGQAQVAELFTDPRNSPAWMDDLERVEPISGELGQPGSMYRLVPKKGRLVFVATVVSRLLPVELQVRLDNPHVSMMATDTFLKLSEGKTRLVSEEVFIFKGLFGAVAGFFARGAIGRAHRRHMESFKRFAESQA